jgi:hypothetical protein
LLLRKEGLHYSLVIKNKYEEDDFEEFQLLILVIFVKIPRIIFKVLHFEFTTF